MKIWSPDLSATQIPPMCCRVYGEVCRVLVREGLWVVEGVNDYGGGQVSDFAMILELKDGRIW
jgi:hypothetical protein